MWASDASETITVNVDKKLSQPAREQALFPIPTKKSSILKLSPEVLPTTEVLQMNNNKKSYDDANSQSQKHVCDGISNVFPSLSFASVVTIQKPSHTWQ